MSQKTEWEVLIAQFLDGRIDQAALEKLEEQLQRNPGARRHLRSMASLENGLRDWAGVKAAREAWREAAPISPGGARGFRSRSWPVAAAIAVGGMLVGFSGSLLFAKGLLLKDPPAIRIALGNEDFEKPADLGTGGVPSMYGIWGGDFAEVVPEDQGVVPPRGAKSMVRFLRADNQNSPPGEVQGVSQLWQVVDLKPVRVREGRGALMVELGAWFNAASVVPEKGHVFGVHLTAFQGGSKLAGEAWKSPRQTALASGSRHQKADEDPAGWQWVSVRIHVPAEADSLLLSVYCGEGVSRGVKRTETAVFPGQYVAGVRLNYFQRPVSVKTPTP
ncbi:MAG: hypothetical protein RLZZ253_3266 [Verrucomicrobiota bacterium]|jgi:hypothetical protein